MICPSARNNNEKGSEYVNGQLLRAIGKDLILSEKKSQMLLRLVCGKSMKIYEKQTNNRNDLIYPMT